MRDSNEKPSSILQYGPQPQAIWRRYRILVSAGSAAIMALATVAVAPEIIASWQRLRWQQTWANCAVVPPFSPGTVVHEEGDVASMPDRVGAGKTLRRRGERSVGVTHDAPAEVRQVWRALGVDGFAAKEPFIFAGRRRDAAGQEFLVIVELHWQDGRAGFFSDEMPIWSIPAAGPAYPTRRYHITPWNTSGKMVHADGTFRIYAGELDPTDPTHFVIPYAVASRRGILDGWVRPTHDEWPPLFLRFRNGPGADTPLNTQDWAPEQSRDPQPASAPTPASRESDREGPGHPANADQPQTR